MPKIECLYCKKEFLASKGQRYCSDDCRENYRREYRLQWMYNHGEPPTEGRCLYEKWVECISGECAKCGWNPTVHAERLRKIKGGAENT